MKFKGRMQVVFTVNFSAETDDDISKAMLIRLTKPKVLDELKCQYVGSSSSTIGVHNSYEYEISSVMELRG